MPAWPFADMAAADPGFLRRLAHDFSGLPQLCTDIWDEMAPHAMEARTSDKRKQELLKGTPYMLHPMEYGAAFCMCRASFWLLVGKPVVCCISVSSYKVAQMA